MRFFSNWIIVLIFVSTGVFAQNSVKHKVVQGESIYSIAKKYEVKEAAIYELNPNVKGKTLQLKTILIIPSNEKKQIANTEIPENHKVTKGESFYSISKKYKMTIAQLEALNPSVSSSNLKIGDELNLSKDKIVSVPKVNTIEENESVVLVQPTEEVALENEVIHTVAAKETKYGISKKYKITIAELERLNPAIVDGLPVGTELVIKKKEVIANVVADEINNDLVEKPIDADALVKADFLIGKASGNLGTRYRSGGTTSNGFDCSGLMFTTFLELDITLPRSSHQMAKYGFEVPKSKAQKGDLIFFATNRRGTISHVGMITEVSDNEIKFIHSSTSSGVIISSSNEDYYSRRFVQINRVLN